MWISPRSLLYHLPKLGILHGWVCNNNFWNGPYRSLLGFHGTTITGELEKASHQLAQQEAAKNEFLYTQKTGSMDRYKAAVIGAGPAGLAVVATLLDQECTPILWIDPNFEAGRLSNYMEVPSNTKVKLFQQYVTTSPSLNRFSSTALMPFVGQDPDKGCPLNLAATMVKSLTDSIRKADSTRVHCVQKVVKELAFSEGRWKIDGADECERVYLATGSHPRSFPDTGVKELLLDDVLTPTRIPELVTDDDTVGVIGSSHSAILALKNLLECATTRPKRIINFFQSPLLFAIYKEGWILYDNTGLKGEAADWAKQELQSGNLEKEKKLERICVKDYSPEEQVKSWQQCTKLVHAVGFDRNPVPKILFNGDELKQISYDPHTGKIADGLYGCGIAFPEKTVDPYGNQEYAVGLWKFMCYAQKKIKL
jgi:hypothetical protein